MIRSMTAYARIEKSEAEMTAIVEIRTYNSRYLDPIIRIPGTYLALEEKIKALLSKKLSRGRVEVRLQVKDDSPAATEFEIDEAKAFAYHQALLDLKEWFGLDSPVTLDHMAGVSGIIRPADADPDVQDRWPAVESCIIEALDAVNEMRKKEGDALAADFNGRLGAIEEALLSIEAGSEGLLAMYQERLTSRIGALTNGITEIDPARIAQEAAFLADRSDISEEIVRARSHIDQFRAIMDASEPGGRKLNFLLQEMNREFNTIGSKTTSADVSHQVVSVKSELEKIREQVQNVE